MSTVYLIPKPADRLNKRHMESGWRHVPLDREAQKELRSRVEPLKDKGITDIYCSDLDTRAAEIVRDILNVRVRPDYGFRRFNVGRHHASLQTHVEDIMEQTAAKWKINPDIPMRGGDSLSSYRKRFFGTFDKIVQREGTFALLLDLREIRSIRSREPSYWTKDQPEVIRTKVYIAKIDTALHKVRDDNAGIQIQTPALAHGMALQ